MSLKRAALLAALGLCVGFGVRAVATLAPSLFLTRAAATLASVLMFVGGLGIVCFLVVFYRLGVTEQHKRLRHVTFVAIVGAVAGLLPEVQGVMRTMGLVSAARLLRYPYIAALAPWVGIVTLLVFFFVLRRAARAAGRQSLARASIAGIVGSTAFLLVASAAALQYFLAAGSAHDPLIPQFFFYLGLPIAVVGFAATLYFFVWFFLQPEPVG